MQVELAEQHAKEHAELAVRLEGIHQELMTLDGPSSMLDSNSLIDLTDNMEDTPVTAPTQSDTLTPCMLHLFGYLMAVKVSACIKQGVSPSPFALPQHSCTTIHQVLRLLSL